MHYPSWKSYEMLGNVWNCLETIKNVWKSFEMLESVWTCLEMSGIVK